MDAIATTPSGIHIVYTDSNHRYKIGRDKESLSFVPSVSTILNDTLPKNLSGWAEKGAVEGVQQLAGRGVDIAFMSADVLLEKMKAHNLRYWQRRDQAADRGTEIHKAFEELGKGKIPKLKNYPDSLRGYVQGVCKWWSDFEPTVLHNEIMVASMEHGYAGRMDLVCDTNNGRFIVDLKTSSAVRESHHFQLAGYEVALEESGYGEVDGKAVLRVDEWGKYQFVESWARPSQFVALLGSFQAQRQFKNDTPEEHKYWLKKNKKAA
jgi:hypothetical protein